MPTPPETDAPDPLDGPEAERLLRAARGAGGDPVMDRVGRALRDLTPEDRAPEPPPVDLWERIDAARRADNVTVLPTAGGSGTTVTAGDRDATVVALPRRWFPVLAAAAVVAVIAAVGGLLLAGNGDDGPEVVAVANLDPLQGSVTAVAELRRADDALRLTVDLSEVDPGADRYLEVWLLRPDVSGMVSLGPVQSDGVYDVPAGIDPSEYPVVDVSFEPFDDDPVHSGDSVLRGPLEFQA